MPQSEISHTFTPPKRKTVLGLRRSAVAEIALALVLLLLLDANLFVQLTHLHGSSSIPVHNRFWSVNPHPFWFVVLFASCKYGTKEGLVAAIASSLALLVGNLPEHAVGQDGYAYMLFVLKLPLLWLISAVAFGELREMHIRERSKLESSLIASEEREHHIAQSYQRVKQIKDQFELRFAGQLRSSISAYHAARKMETLSAAEVLGGLEELVNATLYPEQFSIYQIDKNGLELTLMHGWSEKDGYQRRFISSEVLYQEVIGFRKVLCVANPDHERILDGQGLLVGPLVDRETGEVVGMLKIEKMNFTDLNVSSIEAFSTICEWAGMAIVNARKYQTAKDNSLVNPDHNLLTSNYFTRYTGYITSLARRVDFNVSMLTVKMANPAVLDEAKRTQIARLLADSVDSVLRTVDLAFDHHENSEEYSVVLPATDRKGAQVVLEKIRSTLEGRVSDISKTAKFTYSVQVMYEKQA